MRRLLPLAAAALVVCGCGASRSGSGETATAVAKPAAPVASIDLGAAARKLVATGSAHVIYDLTVEPPRGAPLQFVTHAEGDFDFVHGNASYIATTPLGEASRTVAVGKRRWTRSLGGGAAGAGNAPTGWRRASGPDLSPAGVAPLVLLAADGARRPRRIGPREFEATVVTARTPARARAYLQGVFGAPSGLGQFVLDARGRVVVVRLVNTTALAGHTLTYSYAYSRLGRPVEIRPPG